MMKVAFTSDVYWPRINGVTVSTNIFLNELRKLGHQLRLWAPEYPQTDSSTPPDVGVSRLASFGFLISREDRLVRPWRRKAFFAQLDAFDPDLIHIQTEFMLSLMVRTYARRRRVPVVQTCHTYFEQYVRFYLPQLPARFSEAVARWMTYHLFKRADAIITPTEPMKAVLMSYGITCPITVVPTGIPEEDFAGVDRVQERRQSLWLDRHPELRGRKILLYVGRVAQEKNVDFLLDVLERVQRNRPEAMLVLAGNGPHLETFQATVNHRGLGDSVLCLGYVHRQELKYLYTLSEVFTFASVTETQGLVTIEAMMCGTPAVAIGKMGTKEVMAGDHGGYMVDEDPEQFSQAVLRLLNDPELYAAKSAEAIAYAQNWTASRMAKRIEALYQTVVTTYRQRYPR